MVIYNTSSQAQTVTIKAPSKVANQVVLFESQAEWDEFLNKPSCDRSEKENTEPVTYEVQVAANQTKLVVLSLGGLDYKLDGTDHAFAIAAGSSGQQYLFDMDLSAANRRQAGCVGSEYLRRNQSICLMMADASNAPPDVGEMALTPII